MTPHDTFLTLAATAVDYPLAPSERGRLEAHLAACPACARRASAYRGDALALGHLPAVVLPERRGSEILAAALHPGAVRNPIRLLVLAALLGLLLLGSLAVGAQLLRRDDDLSVVLPVPTATPAPDASAGPDASAPAVPTGTLAVTHADASGIEWIEIVSLDGPKQLVQTEGRDPAWLTDGQLLYTCLHPGWDTSTVCTMDLEGGRTSILNEADRPVPAPNGATVAVHRGTIDVGTTWLLAPDGSQLRELSPGAFTRWSPDGAWLAGQPESAAAQVAIVGADGRGLRVLAPGYDPAWSPSGDRIAYALVEGQRASLRVVDLGTDAIQVLYEAAAGSELTAPAWLPDGRIVFVLDGDLYRLDAGSSEPVRLTTGLAIRADGSASALDLSADGWWIAFSSGDGADAQVGIASVDGGWQMLGLGDGAVTQPRWMPDTSSGPSEPPASAGPGASGTVGSLGTSWAEATVPVTADRQNDVINAVTAGGSGFVAVGRGCVSAENSVSCEAVVWTTADGRTWTRSPASDATDAGAWLALSGVQVGMFDVAAGTPGIVAIGYAARPDIQATTWFSPDGASWERIPLGDANSTRVNAVTWDGRQFVAVGEDRSQATDRKALATATARAAVWTSTDGRTWTRVPHTTALDVGGFIDTMEDPMTGGMRDVGAGPAGLVAVGSVCQNDPVACQPAAWTSSDGTSWTRAADLPKLPGELKAVATSGVGYVAVGAQNSCPTSLQGAVGCPALILTARDGQTWTQQPFEQLGDLRTITWIGDRYFATAPDGPGLLWTSSDGTAWVPAAVAGGPAKPDLGFVVEWQLAATPNSAAWLGPAGMETAPKAWVSVP